MKVRPKLGGTYNIPQSIYYVQPLYLSICLYKEWDYLHESYTSTNTNHNGKI